MATLGVLAAGCGSGGRPSTNNTHAATPARTAGPGAVLQRFVQRRLHGFAHARVLLAERITRRWAVAAVVSGGSAYAAALRRKGGTWTVERGDPIRLRPLRPLPGEHVLRRTQLAAEADARRPIDQAGLWLDGAAVEARGGGPSPRSLTMFTLPQQLDLGTHVLVVFASASRDAAARAWRFTVVADLRD